MNTGDTPAPYDPSRSSPGRMSWTAGLVGFVVGAFLASFIWVQVLATFLESERDDQSELVFVPPGGLPALEEEVEEGTGPRTRVVQRGGEAGQEGEGGGADADIGGGTGPGGTGGGGAGARTGVDDSIVRLGATVAESGLARAFLGEVRMGMEAVRTRVNGAGGVHGRQLEVIYHDDGWDASRGMSRIEDLIREQNVFALAVSPSSEGLNAASNAGIFERHGVPVVGADGLNNSQFINLGTGRANPWIWPVAAATTTQTHIIMKDAWDRAQAAGVELRPAIVFGNTYRFGVEGAYAFNQAYNRLSGGKNIPGFQAGGTGCTDGSRFCGVEAGRGSYQTQINTLQTACNQGARCNFLLLLLEPSTALTWMGQARSADDWKVDSGCCGMAGAQPLFTENFATECKRRCNSMMAWTGYNPVCCSSGNQDVAEFARSIPPRADKNNQFTMGGYLGMTLLVQAFEQVGRDLNRDRLVEVLNSMRLRTGLTHPDGLGWSASNKYANLYARSYEIEYVTTFNGFNEVPGWTAGWTRDPWPGRDNMLP